MEKLQDYEFPLYYQVISYYKGNPTTIFSYDSVDPPEYPEIVFDLYVELNDEFILLKHNKYEIFYTDMTEDVLKDYIECMEEE